MNNKKFKMMDGNEAVAYVSYRTNEVIAIYPITPSSPMGEWADAWASEDIPNIWGTVPTVVEMQSEGGAAGAVHGSLQAGALTTTFTASQGLLLMIPNMYKIAGELSPTVFHIAARSLACQALSIFGDHSDVMATRNTGFAMLASASVQEAMDFALIAQAASLESRIPFLHFFEGFRISHEVAKVEVINDEQMRAMIDENHVREHRQRALSPDNPVLRGTAQNPDVYFQARETVNPFYTACPEIVQKQMDKFARITGRQYHNFEYHGAPDAERVIIAMGSGAEVTHETVDYLTKNGEKIGLLKVRLYRPFDQKAFIQALPKTAKRIAVLDRTKEPGAVGEPLYVDCVSAIYEGMNRGWTPWEKAPMIIGGRFGLSSKEFTPAMVKGVFDHLKGEELKNNFTVGIEDNLTHLSLPYDSDFSVEHKDVFRSLFYGLGSDGTVGANKNSIKIIGENTDNYAQAYFVYDSKKAGAITVSHLRFGPQKMRSSYLVSKANFIGCHQSDFPTRFDMLKYMVKEGTFLLNSAFGPDQVWDQMPQEFQEQCINKKLKFYVIDAYNVAKDAKMGRRINTIMQTCFFAISGVLPKDKAIAEIKKSIVDTYGKKGEEIVQMNLAAVDHTLAHLHQVSYPNEITAQTKMPLSVSSKAPKFVREVLAKIIENRGDELPVRSFPCDGTYPTGTTKWEKRDLTEEIPVWEPDLCIECGKCSIICPHSVIRIKVYDEEKLKVAPGTFKYRDPRDPSWKGKKYTIQVAPEDCTGCTICVDICPAKSKTQPDLKALNMRSRRPILEEEKKNWEFFLEIPEFDRRAIKTHLIKQQQLQQPLFEFSGACSGCGETPYIKLLSQLFGDRSVIANATGCSSIYCGNLPTTPWTTNPDGRGPTWSNSLFEDNAEFGFGMRLSIDKQREYAGELLKKIAHEVGDQLVGAIIDATQIDEPAIYEQRERVEELRTKLQTIDNPEAKELAGLVDFFVKKSVWIMGGDGWAYDIGFGGLDHVLANGRDVNILVLDTEGYSNTGGQMSKATPRAAIAKFAAAGKRTAKKDLGLIAMTYGNVYVASVVMGAKDEQTLKAFLEAEAYPGPSLIIAYSPCIAHGIDLASSLKHQKAAVNSGSWLLYRFNPLRLEKGENPLVLDSPGPKIPLKDYLYMENRYKMLCKTKPEEAAMLLEQAQNEVNARWAYYKHLAAQKMVPEEVGVPG